MSDAIAFGRGDERAFETIYGQQATGIHDFLRWTVRDETLAEDLTQSTFLRAWERRESLRDPAALRGWLYRIAHNLAMNEVTRRRSADELDEEAPIATGAAGPEALASQGEVAELVWDAAASLEPRQYAVLDLSVRKGLTNGEVAEVLGLDGPATSLTLHRAKEALGNAVRYLLVARRRRHCERLAELVPEGVRRLTPQQRATVDRHMRRCDNCQRAAQMLTTPEALFGGVPLVTLPARLANAPWLPSASGPGASQSSHVPAGHAAAAGHAARSTFGLGAAAIGAVGITAIVILALIGPGRSDGPAALAATPPLSLMIGVPGPTASPIQSVLSSAPIGATTAPGCGTGVVEPAATANGEMTVCPAIVRAGGTLTVTSLTPCAKPAATSGQPASWVFELGLEIKSAVGSFGPSDSRPRLGGRASDPDSNGNWATTIGIPAEFAPGPYSVAAVCFRFSTDGQDPNGVPYAYAPVPVTVLP